MLPLWTKVTLLRLFSMAYSKADLSKRSDPSIETGLIPIPDVSGNLIFENSSGKDVSNSERKFFVA